MTTTSEHTNAPTAETAADEGKHVAEVAKAEAQQVAEEARTQVRGLLDDARTQVDQQSQVQRDKLVQTMQTFADDLQEMAARVGGSGLAASIASEVADRTRKLTSELDGREPGEILDRARDFARRRPGVFLLGAAAAGVLVGRFARGAKAASDSDDATPAPSTPRSTTPRSTTPQSATHRPVAPSPDAPADESRTP